MSPKINSYTYGQLIFNNYIKTIRGERLIFSTNSLEQLYILMPKKEVSFLYHQCTKYNLKWIKDLYVRTKTINPLEESIGVNLYKHRVGDFFFFLRYATRRTSKKWKDNLGFINIEKFCVQKTWIRWWDNPYHIWGSWFYWYLFSTGDKKAPGGSAIPSWVLFESPMGSRTPGKPSFESYSAFTGCVTWAGGKLPDVQLLHL